METIRNLNWMEIIKRLGEKLPMIIGTAAVFTFIVGLMLNVAGAIKGLDMFVIFILSLGLGLGAIMIRSSNKVLNDEEKWYTTKYE